MSKHINSKANKVLRYLQQNGTITGAQAWKMFRLYRLSGVIFRLRSKGHIIETLMCEDPNDNYTKYAKYRYVGTINKDNNKEI